MLTKEEEVVLRTGKNVQEGREGGGGSQKIGFFCSMGKKENVKAAIS